MAGLLFLLFWPISQLASACFLSPVTCVCLPAAPVPCVPAPRPPVPVLLPIPALPGGLCPALWGMRLCSCPSAAACLWPTLLCEFLLESRVCPSAFLRRATRSSPSGALLPRSGAGGMRCGHGAAAELRERRRSARLSGLRCFIYFHFRFSFFLLFVLFPFSLSLLFLLFFPLFSLTRDAVLCVPQ